MHVHGDCRPDYELLGGANVLLLCQTRSTGFTVYGGSAMAFDPEYVDISFEGRNLQLRMDQITVNNLAKTFRLIPQTVILVSACGTVALPDNDAVF